jgi:hypothetical protein
MKKRHPPKHKIEPHNENQEKTSQDPSQSSTPPTVTGKNYFNGGSFLKKHEFVPRVSILDDYEPTSMLRQSQFIGFYNCLYVIMLFYFFVAPLLKYKEKGVLFDVTLLNMM